MAYEDKNLTCTECGQSFIFSADDQAYHAEKGYMNEPSAAPRAAKRGATDPAAAASGTIAVPARCTP